VSGTFAIIATVRKPSLRLAYGRITTGAEVFQLWPRLERARLACRLAQAEFLGDIGLG